MKTGDGVIGVGILAAVVFLPSGMVVGADVSLYTIGKGIYYEQTGAGAAVVLTNNGYGFEAEVRVPGGGVVSGAWVKRPDGTEQALEQDGNDWEFSKKYNTRAKLDTNYADGAYLVTINAAHDGRKSAWLALEGNSFPNTPHVSNYAEAQHVNAGAYFFVRWDPFIGGGAGDFIQLRIEDAAGARVFETPDYAEAGALNGTMVFAIVRPGTLLAGKRYEGRLLFQKKVAENTRGYPGVTGLAVYFKRTSFSLVASTAAAADVDSFELSKGRSFEQTNAGALVPDPGDAFIFQAKVNGAADGAVLESTVVTPASVVVALTADSKRRDYEARQSFNSQGELDEWYPDGTYTVRMSGIHDGLRQPVLALVSGAYPPAPHVNSFDPSQEVRAEQDLLVAWDRWEDGQENDFIQLRIENKAGDKLFETPDFTKSGALNGRATSAVVPAGTLVPGKTHKARIVFKRFVALDAASYPGVLGMGDYFARTKFDVKTAEPDIKTVSLFKGQQWVQVGAGLLRPEPAVFRATVTGSATGSVVSAALSSPLGASGWMVGQADGQNFVLRDLRADLAGLSAVYPDGPYRFTINTAHEGSRNLEVTLAGSACPNAPELRNFFEAQAVDAGRDFFLNWQPFAGGTRDDFMYLEAVDSGGNFAFSTGSFGKGDALDGTSTAAQIPVDTLIPGEFYRSQLVFQKIISTAQTNFPGSDILAGYEARTAFFIATVGIGNPATFSSWRINARGRIELTLNGLVGACYVIEGSSNLVDWVALGNTTGDGASVIFTDWNGADRPWYFYRALLDP